MSIITIEQITRLAQNLSLVSLVERQDGQYEVYRHAYNNPNSIVCHYGQTRDLEKIFRLLKYEKQVQIEFESYLFGCHK